MSRGVEEPSDVADQVMLLLDQVTKVKGAKNEKGEIMPLSEEKKRLNYNLLVQAGLCCASTFSF